MLLFSAAEFVRLCRPCPWTFAVSTRVHFMCLEVYT